MTATVRRLPPALFGIRNVQPPRLLPFSGAPASFAAHFVLVGVTLRPVVKVIDGSSVNTAPAVGAAGSERTLTALIVAAAGFPGAGLAAAH